MRDFFLVAVFLLHVRDAPCCPPLSLNSTALSRRRRGGSLVLRKKQKSIPFPSFFADTIGKKSQNTNLHLNFYKIRSKCVRRKFGRFGSCAPCVVGKCIFARFKTFFLICFVVGSRSSWIFFSSPLESQICIVKVQLSFTQRRLQSFKETEEHTPSHIHGRKKRKEILFPACRPVRGIFEINLSKRGVSRISTIYVYVHTLGGCGIFSVSSAAISKNRKRPTVSPAFRYQIKRIACPALAFFNLN